PMGLRCRDGTEPVENRLARPIRSPSSSRRVCMARWSQIIQLLPSFLVAGGSTGMCPVHFPLLELEMGRKLFLRLIETMSMRKIPESHANDSQARIMSYVLRGSLSCDFMMSRLGIFLVGIVEPRNRIKMLQRC